jgi:c-di-GMP-binding flagellar brake protein YcgR
MGAEIDQRKYPRLNTMNAGYTVYFHAHGSEITGCQLMNISAGGCGIEVQMAEARVLEAGDLLDPIWLDHPDLPLVPLTGVILRVLGKVAGKTTGYILVGVEFQDITPFVQSLIADHVTAKLIED